MNELHRMIYYSRATPAAAADMQPVIYDVLAAAERNNPAFDVTGALLACDGWFLQALEGKRTNVGTIYGRLGTDPRHESLQVIWAGPIAQREFGEWSMCGRYLSPTDQEIVEVLESNQAFDPPRLTADTAMNLLRIVRRLQTRGRHR